MSYSQILYEAADGVATITLNRPERLNAWTGVMAGELRAAMTEAERDHAVKAIVLTTGQVFAQAIDDGNGCEEHRRAECEVPGSAFRGRSEPHAGRARSF